MPYKDPQKRNAMKRSWRKNNPEKQKAAAKEWRDSNKEKVSTQNRKQCLKREGWTPEEYEQARIEQNDLCAICGFPSDSSLHADHNHKTGKKRKLLCGLCNSGIGFLRENVDILNSAIEYLKEYDE